MAATIVTVLEFRTELAAPPERVFAALTEAGLLERWFCDAAETHATNGGRLLLRWTGEAATLPFEARWVVFEPPNACAYEGGHAGYPDGYAGRVGFELAPRPGGTTLVTRHRLPARPDYEPFAASYRAAWPRALARLTDCLA
ncbi:MAG TPA: SRPBCC family protein [Candidatus Limnocylindria bacterium]|nr:SRPBCC family protein [Candidatus Limnocylindria bacterium]